MDLSLEQSKQLTAFVDDWSKDKKIELETSFGENYVVDSMTFLQIAQRIRTKGFEEIQQEDYLNIITPNELRFTLRGIGVIQSYCRDDTMNHKEFTVMFKTRNSRDSNLNLDEYNIRFKTRREEELGVDDPQVVQVLNQWPTQQKAFRLIRRWSFKGKGIRIDLSMVRQTPVSRGGFQWSTTFLQRSVLKEAPRYEVEVELLHDTEHTKTPADALRSLIRGVGEVQRAIQKNSLLIRKSVANHVRAEYQKMTGTSKIRGVKAVTLQLENMTEKIDDRVINIRTGFNVTDKADGLRAMGYVDSTGELYLLDQNMNVYRTGLRSVACASSLVDGEWITVDKHKEARNDYLIFDIYHAAGGKKVSHLPFMTYQDGAKEQDGQHRYRMMNEWYDQWADGEEITVPKQVSESNRLQIMLKEFEFGNPGDTSIFTSGCSKVLDTPRIYHTDGLILTSNSQPIPDNADVRFDHQFKWKPSKDNTVDFLIKYEADTEFPTMDKITTTLDPSNQTTIQHKTMRLYVGSSKSIITENPRAAVLDQMIDKEPVRGGYHPVLFTPVDFPDTMANTCYVLVETNGETNEEYAMTTDTKEPISDESVVEMRYDPSREPGWRWVPSRIRHDKSERLMRAKATAKAMGKSIVYSGIMNDEAVAKSVWNSIHEPITESMIRTGNDAPNEAENEHLISIQAVDTSKKYYERKAPKQNIALVKGLQDFHNKYIKNEILIKRSLLGGRTKLLDLACGKAGDLFKWFFGGAKFVVGVDYAGENITNPNDGAYRRYVDLIQDFKKKTIPNIAFAIGNSAKNIVNGEAGANPQESDILRSIFGRVDPEGSVPKYIENVMARQFQDGADVAACMFALHYFFETKETLDGFLTNLSETVRVGGLFVGCCFDGDLVFRLLRGLERGQSANGMEEDVPIWSITKQYDAVELSADESSIGNAIDVEFISIGSTHREYLVSFAYLTERMREIGFRLLNKDELAEMKLSHSTNTFNASFEMANRREQKYNMRDSVKEFSFLNRWFIFKREGEKIAAEVPKIELPVADEPASAAAAADNEKQEAEKQEEKPEASAYDQPPLPTKKFEKNQVFLIGADAPESNLTLDDKHAGRWLSLSAPFPIPDPEDPAVQYPTVEHYLAAMKLKEASNQPSLARTLMSTKGQIHQQFGFARLKETINDESVRDFKLLADEAKEVHKEMSKGALTGRGVIIDESIWQTQKDEFLMNALKFRYQRDARFQSIVEAAKADKKYILYLSSVEVGIPELSGVRHGVKKTITGGNKVGRFIMKLAQF